MSLPDDGKPGDSSPGQASNEGNAGDHRTSKRPRRNDAAREAHPHRRKSACTSCRTRKVKCDNVRPCCAFCRSSGVECVYLDSGWDKLVLDPATKLVVQRLDQIMQGVQGINTLMLHQGNISPQRQLSTQSTLSASKEDAIVIERSKDYLQIPAHSTTADTVLNWQIFGGRYPSNAFIQTLFTNSSPHNEVVDGSAENFTKRSSKEHDLAQDVFVVPGGFRSLSEEKIPSLVDNFLQNVHTKNPILDVEALVRHGRRVAEQGVGWDAQSCLVLLACALGCIAKPFELALMNAGGSPQDGQSSAILHSKDLQQAESCFILACRRLGLLKYSIISSQCHFFAGVYLMYTLRPLASWQQFFQASTLYQLHLKTVGEPSTGETPHLEVHHHRQISRTQRRLEQSLYWSCFKSECEFRVELPLPQSDIANIDNPNLFPSPPDTDLGADDASVASLQRFVNVNYGAGFQSLGGNNNSSYPTTEAMEVREHGKRLCNEEESWCYYLTEVALRRIGNRIINTFYRQDCTSWINIKPLITIALEFEAQITSWSENLPPAMQRYETSSSIRAPRFDPPASNSHSSASKELSWATDNRLLEMRSWLYQPFLYYAIHCGYPHENTPSPYPAGIAPAQQPDGFPRSNVHNVLNHPSPPALPKEDNIVLRGMIIAGIECNLKILDDRSLRHRHHGLWYDLRAITTASLILLALVRSGNVSLIPGGLEGLFGLPQQNSDAPSNPTHPLDGRTAGAASALGNNSNASGAHIGGRLGNVMDILQFWEDEAPDMKNARAFLHELILETRKMVSGSDATPAATTTIHTRWHEEKKRKRTVLT